MSGNAGPACPPAGISLGPEFQAGSGAGVPNEWINALVAPDGSWSATFVVPSWVGGEAMTRGSTGGRVTPGVWQFRGPICAVGAVASADFTVTAGGTLPSRFVGMAATADGKGYWLAQAGGGVFSFGDATFYGSLPAARVVPAAPITAMAATPDRRGYWLVGADGGVFAFGDATFYGSLPGQQVDPAAPVVGITPTPDGRGYWLVGADGGVFAFGDAAYLGNGVDGVPKVALLASSSGGGYTLPTAVGIASTVVGDAVARPLDAASLPATMDAPVSAAAAVPGGGGYWEVGADGGVFSFGTAGFFGSLPALGFTPPAPVVAMAATPDGRGYWLAGANGQIYPFGDAVFAGSGDGAGLPWLPSPSPSVAVRPGTYTDGSFSTPHYLVSVEPGVGGLQGTVRFVYQDGRTDTVFSFVLNGSAATLSLLAAGERHPAFYQDGALVLPGCGAYLTWASPSLARPQSCEFAWQRGGG